VTRQWWTTQIFGHDVGVVISHYRAEPVNVGLWEVTVTRRRAMRDGWRDEPAEPPQDWGDGLLEQVASKGHPSEMAAHLEAIDYFCSNSVVLAVSHADSLRHNTEMIRTLTQYSDQVPP